MVPCTDDGIASRADRAIDRQRRLAHAGARRQLEVHRHRRELPAVIHAIRRRRPLALFAERRQRDAPAARDHEDAIGRFRALVANSGATSITTRY